jgi:hypothetical protein
MAAMPNAFIRNILDAVPKYMQDALHEGDSRDSSCPKQANGLAVIGTSAGQMRRESAKSHVNPRRKI